MVTSRTAWPRVAFAVLAGILLAACSSAAGTGEETVFTVATGFSQGGPASTIDTVNIGVPETHNVTGRSVRIERVSLASEPPGVRLKSVTAYLPGPGVGVMLGNLLKRSCSRTFKPYPVTADVTPPHADADWNLVVAITFARPGRYDLHHVKIFYVTNGHQGWQYQNLNTTMIISAARKGAKPRFDGCPP
jgi:hypothetical protein